MELETKRLRLIPLVAGDLRLRIEGRQRLESKLGLRVTEEPSYGDAAYDQGAHSAMARAADSIVASPNSSLWHTFWQIVSKQDKCIVGEIDFHGPPNASGEVEFGGMMRPEYRNRGYATEVARAIVAWAFQQPDVAAVSAVTDQSNAASHRVLQKLGFHAVEKSSTTIRWRLCKVSSK